MTVIFLLTLAVFPQENTELKVLILIDKLDSKRVEEREDAEKSILEFGETARNALDRAAEGSEGHIRLHVQALLKRLDIQTWLQSLPEGWGPDRVIDGKGIEIVGVADRIGFDSCTLLRGTEQRVVKNYKEVRFGFGGPGCRSLNRMMTLLASKLQPSRETPDLFGLISERRAVIMLEMESAAIRKKAGDNPKVIEHLEASRKEIKRRHYRAVIGMLDRARSAAGMADIPRDLDLKDDIIAVYDLKTRDVNPGEFLGRLIEESGDHAWNSGQSLEWQDKILIAVNTPEVIEELDKMVAELPKRK